MHAEILKEQTLDSGQKMRFTVRIGAGDVASAVRDGMLVFARSMRVAPGENGDLRSALEARMGAPELERSLTTYVAQQAAASVINQRDLRIMFDPAPTSPRETTLFDGGPVELTVEVVLRPTFELTDYGPVTVTLPPAIVSDETVEFQLRQAVEQRADIVPAEGDLQLGDFAVFDLDTAINGEPAPALSGQGMRVVVEGGSMPDGFIEHVLGMQAGEERTFEFDDHAPGSAEGAAPDHIRMTAKFLERHVRVVPELTDELVKTAFIGSGANTVDELRQSLRRQLEAQMAAEIDQRREAAVDSQLAGRIKGHIPDLYIERSRDELMMNLQQQLAMQNMTLQQYIQQSGTDEQHFGFGLAMQARDSLRQGFALDALFDHLGLELEDADVEAALHELAPGREDEARATFDKSDTWFVVRDMARRLKAHNEAVRTAVFEEAAAADGAEA